MSVAAEGGPVSDDWEVFDMAHDHTLCLNENHQAEFGPMSEAAARAMEQSNPRGYWARKIPNSADADA